MAEFPWVKCRAGQPAQAAACVRARIHAAPADAAEHKNIMSHQRFFVNKIADNTAVITGDDFTHAHRVLRCEIGDMLLVFNYEHGEFEAEIIRIDNNEQIMTVAIKKQTKTRERQHAQITAIIGVIKKDKMEFVLEKLTELGVDVIIPLITKRTVVKIKDDDKKEARWNSIIYSAVKQCGRISTPLLLPFVNDVKNISTSEIAHKFFIYEKADDVFLIDKAMSLPPDAQVCFVIGPEGGFDNSEAETIISKGFTPVSIGDTTLRAETAAIAAATVFVQSLRRSAWKEKL